MYILQILISRLQGIFFCSVALFVLFSLISYNPSDPSMLYAASDASACTNWCGWYGAQVSAWLLFLFASAAYLVVPALFFAGLHILYPYHQIFRRDRTIALAICVPLLSMFLYSMQFDWIAQIRPGGICGMMLIRGLEYCVDASLIPAILFFAFWSLIIMVAGFAWVMPAVSALQRLCTILPISRLLTASIAYVRAGYMSMMQRMQYAIAQIKNSIMPPAEQPQPTLESVVYDKDFWQQSPVVEEHAGEQTASVEIAGHEQLHEEVVVLQEEVPARAVYVKPSVVEFMPKKQESSKADRQEQQSQAQVLEEKLKRFGIKGSVLTITAGPVVTLFEYQPQIDVPISRILAREDDLALALQALSLRIIAPIPGRSVVGFEVANAKRKMVLFAESVNSVAFQETDAHLPLIIGQNTIGEQIVIDLAKMPHLLVAGSTGSGKSVALNAMLLSLLCKATPDEVRMILIDPKRLEFAAYADIPHLMFPIVTDPKVAMNVLQWAITMMEQRYEQMAAAGVRNIYDYRNLAKSGAKGADGQPYDMMPYIVIVIDELADLMMVSGKEIEGSIARLAQMARAAGIHLVLATQRPSVDVITGVVKVNFPARLACKVTTKIDSRTILDTGGAEKLLGKGDMLFLDTQGKISRLHGAYVTDQEIAAIVHHVKSQRTVVYEQLPVADKDCTVQGEDAVLYKELIEFVKTVDEVSISLLQRRFRIGYNRSARLIDLLESQGIIMPSSGSKTRKVLH